MDLGLRQTLYMYFFDTTAKTTSLTKKKNQKKIKQY